MMRTMVAAVAFAALATSATAQTAAPAPAAPAATPAPDTGEAKKVLAGIKSDTGKLAMYCEAQALYAKADDAAEKNDEKGADDFGKQAEEKTKGLGADFEKINQSTAEVDPESAEGKELYAAWEDLDKGCPAAK